GTQSSRNPFALSHVEQHTKSLGDSAEPPRSPRRKRDSATLTSKENARLLRTGRFSLNLQSPVSNCRYAHGCAGGFAALAASILAFSCACWSGVSTSFSLAIVPA